MDFVGAARSVLHVARHPENPSHSVMMHTKANCSEKGKAIAFRIDNSGFHWLGQTEVSEEQLGQQLSVASERPQDELDAATSFLEAELRAGPVLSTDLFESAREALISDATLKRARQKLIKEKRLKFTRKGMPGKRGGGRVFWELQDGVSREPENQMSHKIVNSSSSMCEEIEPIEDLLAHVDGALVVRECEAD